MRTEWWVGARTPKATTDFLSRGLGSQEESRGGAVSAPSASKTPERGRGGKELSNATDREDMSGQRADREQGVRWRGGR